MDLDLALEAANAGALETQSTIKKYQNQVRDAQVKVDEESRLKGIAQDAKVNGERKAGAMQNALEKPEPCLSRLTVLVGPLNKNLLTAMKLLLILPTRTKPLLVPRGSWRMSSAP